MTEDVEKLDEKQPRPEAGMSEPEGAAEETSLVGLSPQIAARLEDAGLSAKQDVEEALAAGEEAFLDLPGIGPATLEAVQAWRDESDREDAGQVEIAREALGLGKTCLAEGERDLAQEHYEKALEIFEELADRAGIAESHEELAIVNLLQAEYKAARSHYERALTSARSLEDEDGERAIAEQLRLLDQLQVQ